MRLDRVCLTYRREEVRTGVVNYPLIILAGAVINFPKCYGRERTSSPFSAGVQESSAVFHKKREFAR